LSPLYLYAVLGAPLAAGASGIEGEPIETVALGGAWLAVGRLAQAPAPKIETLRAHDRAVRGLQALSEAILPARFGQAVEDSATLERRFAPVAERLKAGLEKVEGCVQMTLRLQGVSIPETAGEPGDQPGTAYLLGKRRLVTGAGLDPAIDALRAGCAVVVRGERVGWSERGSRLTFYHLVPRALLAEYTAVVDAHRAALPRLAVSGPWPPYAFTDE
jgi:hypothetical protein